MGNGRLDAVANAIQSATGMDFHLENYSEHSLDEGSTSRAASCVGLDVGRRRPVNLVPAPITGRAVSHRYLVRSRSLALPPRPPPHSIGGPAPSLTNG